ncbi:unnamed protein product [Gongylonema pulchrum]|uniref:BZIP domain-containing protein n=1 Tax=Gongylonema pulchrum TaxID=637853 RepID=A0A183E9D9_9BILA|nr:unnamed protein product [Gongylonema pulchrum]
MNVDIAPTILDIASVTVPEHMDGRSLLPLIRLQGNGNLNPRSYSVSEKPIRAPVMNVDIAPTILDIASVTVPEHMDGRSLLPIIRLQGNGNLNPRSYSVTEKPKMAKLTRIRDRLMKQRNRLGKEARVQKACVRPEFREPCSEGQQWKCVRDDSGKWRIYKCHVYLNAIKECDCSASSRRRYRRSRRRNNLMNQYDLHCMNAKYVQKRFPSENIH